MKKTIAIMMMLMMPMASFAADANTVNMKVNGLVCDFCAQALDKVFSKRDEVAGIKVDLDGGLITVQMKDGQALDDAALTKLVVDSGYNVVSITRGAGDAKE